MNCCYTPKTTTETKPIDPTVKRGCTLSAGYIDELDKRLLKIEALVLEDLSLTVLEHNGQIEVLKEKDDELYLKAINQAAELAYLRGYTQSLAEEISKLSQIITLIRSDLHI